MTAESCPREGELLDALGRCCVGPELDSHVQSCASCAELRAVAGALLDDRAEAMIEAAVPPAASMWLRIHLRRRQEAAAAARRSLLIGHAATLLIAVALAVMSFGGDLTAEARSIIESVRLSTPLLVAIAAWAVLAPLAGWVAVRQK